MPVSTNLSHRSTDPTEPILIKDIYQLLAYSLRAYEIRAFDEVRTDNLEGLDSILTEMLLAGVAAQVNRGLEYGYKERLGELQFVRGRFNALETRVNRLRGRILASCRFDEFSIDTPRNQILKATLLTSLSKPSVTAEQKVRIKRFIPTFNEVSTLPIPRLDWKFGPLERNFKSYKLLMHLCFMLLRGLSPSQSLQANEIPGIEISNKPMLFQAFVTNYFQRHYPSLRVRREPVLKAGINTPPHDIPTVIPRLQPDIILESQNKSLLIDTKFYKQILGENRFGKKILNPTHRYQLTTYVQHATKEREKPIDGMLLYALPEKEEASRCNFHWQELGQSLFCRTLNLNQSFEGVSESLDEIVRSFLGDLPRKDL